MSSPDLAISAKRFRPAVICGFLLAAVAIVYAQTLRFGFSDYDDPCFVRDCPQVLAGLTGKGIYWAFASGPLGEWYPLAMLSHMLDCQLFGLNASWHHLTNVLLHAATTVGLFLVLWRMTAELWPSGLAAILFAVHPQHVESVAWIAERRDVLSGLFFVLTLAAYGRYVRGGRTVGGYLLVALMLALGLMAKSMLVTVPPLLLLLDYWPLGRFGQAADLPPQAIGVPRQSFWHLAIEKLPLLAIALADCAMTLATHYEPEKSILLSWPARISNALVSLVTYLFQFFYPANLAPYYPVPAGGHPAWKVAGATALLAIVTAGVWLGRRRFPYLLVGWFWFLGMILPVLGLIHVSDHAMADRYMYLPGIGLTIAVSWGAARLVAHWHAAPAMVGLCTATLIAILIAQAARQTFYWHDGVDLWAHALAVTGENTKAEESLGVALYSADRLDDAVAHFRRALLLPPIDPTAFNNLGIALARQGKLDEATAQFSHAIELDPRDAASHANLAAMLVVLGHRDNAIQEYRRAIELDPACVRAHYQLGKLLAEIGDHDAAIDQYQRAVELDWTQAVAYADLAASLAQRGLNGEAIRNYRRALQLAPGDKASREALDRLLAAGRQTSR